MPKRKQEPKVEPKVEVPEKIANAKFRKTQPVRVVPASNPLKELEGEKVNYYSEGYRVGTLVEVTGTCVRVRPIASRYSKTEPQCIKLPFDAVFGPVNLVKESK